MTCDGRYAEAWQYGAFWCRGSLLSGTHQGAGPADAALSDAYKNFVNGGVEANVGMVLYNVTADTDGLVTAVTAHTVTAAGVTWDAGDEYRIAPLDANQISEIEHYLDITSGNIHAALASVGACDCTLATWATGVNGFLTKLNIIEAGAFHVCPCGRPGPMTAEDRRQYLEWSDSQLGRIRSGEIEVCDGYTGSEYPAFGTIEQGLTVFNIEQIIINREKRNRGG